MTTQRRAASLIRRSAAGAAVLVVLLTAGCSTTTAGAPVMAAAGPNAPSISAPPGSTGADATDTQAPDDSTKDPSATDGSSAESSGTTSESSEPDGSTNPSASGPASSPAAPTPSGRPTVDSSAPGSGAGNGPAPAGKQDQLNLRSIDPCTFFAKDTFDKLDEKVQGILSYADLASCHLQFTGTNAKKDIHSWNVDLAMDFRYTTPAELATTKPGTYSVTSRNGTSVIAGTTKEGDCLRAFQLPGDFATAVIEVKSKSDPCKAADLGLDSAITAVGKGELEPVTWPRGSLIPMDLCATFQELAGKELGAPVTAKPLGLHTCSWSTADGHALSMNLEAAPWPPLGFDTTAGKITVAGHPALATNNAGNGQFLYLGAVNLGPIPVGVEHSVQTVQVFLGGKGDGKTYQQGFPRLLAALTAGH